jgi:hypothetical protein
MIASKQPDYAVDRAHRAKLAALAKERGVSLTAMLAQLIDEAHNALVEADRERRRAAVAWFRTANLEDMPDPETLSHQIDQTIVAPHLRRR